MTEQNDVKGLVSCGSNCQQITELPESVQEPVEELFGYAFSLLTKLGIRDTELQSDLRRQMNTMFAPFVVANTLVPR